jgi:hypothetical protein
VVGVNLESAVESMTRGAKDTGGGTAVGRARFAGQIAYDGEHEGAATETDIEVRDAGEPEAPFRPSLADLDALAEPVFPTDWLTGPPASLADHPLLRGLLLELPPKGTAPAGDYLDRWFDATRAILELLYVQGTPVPRG